MNTVFIKSTLEGCMVLLSDECAHHEGVAELIEEMIMPSLEMLEKHETQPGDASDPAPGGSCKCRYHFDRVDNHRPDCPFYPPGG